MLRTAIQGRLLQASFERFAAEAWEIVLHEDYVNGPHIELISKHLVATAKGDIRKLLVNLPPSCGKALAVETRVITTEGWKNHGDLRAGDVVFGPNGKPVQVLAHNAPHEAESAEIYFKGPGGKACKIVASQEHLWQIQRKVGGLWQTMIVKTSELLAAGTKGSSEGGRAGDRILSVRTTKRTLRKSSQFWRVRKVKPVGPQLVNCIQVEGGLYLAGRDLIPTHNSTLISILFPAWVWTWNPAACFMCSSYDMDLALRDSTECRRLVESDWYQGRWGHAVRFAHDEKQKAYFRTTAGGWRLTTTRGRRATGYHPHYIIIDDPLSVYQASFKRERQGWRDYYSLTLTSRGVAKKVRYIMTQQRLHPEDPSGVAEEENARALKAGKEEPWHVVRLPMRYDPALAMKDRGYGGDFRTQKGALLFEEVLNEETVSEMELRMTAREAQAQLQQAPTVAFGQFFRVENLKWVARKQLPDFERLVRFWDRASLQGMGCFTAGVLVGIHKKRVFILHVCRGQWDPDEGMSKMYACAMADTARFGRDKYEIGIEEEGGSGGKIAALDAYRRLAGFRVHLERPTSGKVHRAQPLANAMSFDEVFILEEDEETDKDSIGWTADFIDELRDFPGGAYADQVDAAGGAYLRVLEKPELHRTEIAGSKRWPTCCDEKCERPVMDGELYCCLNCQIHSAEGLVAGQHTDECELRRGKFLARSL